MPVKKTTGTENLSTKIKQEYKIWSREIQRIVGLQKIHQFEYNLLQKSHDEFKENSKTLQRLAGDNFDTNHADITEIESKISEDLEAIQKIKDGNTDFAQDIRGSMSPYEPTPDDLNKKIDEEVQGLFATFKSIKKNLDSLNTELDEVSQEEERGDCHVSVLTLKVKTYHDLVEETFKKSEDFEYNVQQQIAKYSNDNLKMVNEDAADQHVKEIKEKVKDIRNKCYKYLHRHMSYCRDSTPRDSSIITTPTTRTRNRSGKDLVNKWVEDQKYFYHPADITYVVVDTNVIMLEHHKLSILMQLEEVILYIPHTVQNELDKKKEEKINGYRTPAGVNAQVGNRWLSGLNKEILRESLDDYQRISQKFPNNDDRILETCVQLRKKGIKVFLVTSDIALRNKAEGNYVPTGCLTEAGEVKKFVDTLNDLCNFCKLKLAGFHGTKNNFTSAIQTCIDRIDKLQGQAQDMENRSKQFTNETFDLKEEFSQHLMSYIKFKGNDSLLPIDLDNNWTRSSTPAQSISGIYGGALLDRSGGLQPLYEYQPESQGQLQLNISANFNGVSDNIVASTSTSQVQGMKQPQNTMQLDNEKSPITANNNGLSTGRLSLPVSDNQVSSTSLKDRPKEEPSDNNEFENIEVNDQAHNNLNVNDVPEEEQQPVAIISANRVRKLRKRLRQTEALEAKIRSGEIAEPSEEEQKKVNGKDDAIKQYIAALEEQNEALMRAKLKDSRKD